MRNAIALIATLLVSAPPAWAQPVPPHALGLDEELVELAIDNGVQRGVLSKRKETATPTDLIVLLPGYPSVVRPEVVDRVMRNSRLNGNFLVRARRHLSTDQTMTLLVDCHTAVGEICTPAYQASPDRHRHVKALIEAARQRAPSVRRVFLLSTSAGSVSSAFVARYGQTEFAGVIHTAAIDPTAPKSYAELLGFDYGALKMPQAFIHHADDPCQITGYGYIRGVAERHRLPLITVTGGGDFRGPACQAFTQHGFAGKEAVVMQHIVRMIGSAPPWSAAEL